MAAIDVEKILALVPGLLEARHSRVWVVYDKNADILYINFKEPSHVDDSELTEDDVVIRYEKGEVVGITASTPVRGKQRDLRFTSIKGYENCLLGISM